MKMMVKLVVLFASLLVVTGTAFAVSCCEDVCYKVTVTGLASTYIGKADWSFCFFDDNLADVCALSPGGPTPLFQVSFFNQNLIDQAISISPVSTGVYMRFHGSEDDIFNGLFYLGGDQYNIHGVEEPCPL